MSHACTVITRTFFFAAASLACSAAFAQVEVYEANVSPEELGWNRLPAGPPQGERAIEDGWFIQTMSFPGQSFFRRELGWAVGVDGFFVEWRAITNNPAWLIDEWHVPTVVSAAGRASSYHTVMTESAAALFRDPIFPLVVAEVSVGSPHTYRVEVFPDEYIWYVDGVVIDAGVAEGPYPDPDAFLIWGAEVTYDGAPAASTAWDYVRVGRIPDDGSGDYDSDQALTLFDYYFVHDCLTKDKPGTVGDPGCRFADFDFDGDVDLRDFADFQSRFTDYPCEPPCWPRPFAAEVSESAQSSAGK